MAATSTGQHPLEVVRPLDWLLVAVAAVAQEVLHLLEKLKVDDGMVTPGVKDSVVGDNPDVVLVAQHPVHFAAVEGTSRSTPRPLGSETSAFEFLGQLADRPLACGVGLEGPRHMRCTFLVDGNGSDLPAIDELPGVQVADRRPVGGAADLGFLLHALAGFGGEVGAVELGDRRHDAVEQLAAGCLVDVLRGGHDLGSGGSDVHDDADVVLAGAGEAVDLVDDDVVDVSCQTQPLQHGLELGSSSRAGGFATVEILVDDGGTDLLGLTATRLALGGDGEAFFAEVGLGLIGG